MITLVLLRSSDAEELLKGVMDKAKEGWKLQGGISAYSKTERIDVPFSTSTTENTYYLATMVKEGEEL